FFFFSSRRRHTRCYRDWSSDVCSSDLRHTSGRWLAESFSLAASGHWYGGNVTSAHHWPLETGEQVLDPFLSTSNQTSPAWVTSRSGERRVREEGRERRSTAHMKTVTYN